jgi:hypothetical protein
MDYTAQKHEQSYTAVHPQVLYQLLQLNHEFYIRSRNLTMHALYCHAQTVSFIPDLTTYSQVLYQLLQLNHA